MSTFNEYDCDDEGMDEEYRLFTDGELDEGKLSIDVDIPDLTPIVKPGQLSIEPYLNPEVFMLPILTERDEVILGGDQTIMVVGTMRKKTVVHMRLYIPKGLRILNEMTLPELLQAASDCAKRTKAECKDKGIKIASHADQTSLFYLQKVVYRKDPSICTYFYADYFTAKLYAVLKKDDKLLSDVTINRAQSVRDFFNGVYSMFRRHFGDFNKPTDID